MKPTKRINRIILVTTMMGAMLCSTMATTDQTEAAKKKPKLNKTSATLQVGKTIKLRLKNNKKKVTWSTSNKKVAKVNKKGKVTAISAGTAKITAKVAKKKYRCIVRVKAATTATAAPTMTPLPNKVKNNYTKLKSYITSKGVIGDSGNKTIYGKYGDNLNVSISYDAVNKAYIFESGLDYVTGDNVHIKSKIKMVSSESNLGRATLENTAYVGTYYAVLKSEVDVATINGNHGPTWTTQMANPKDGSIQWEAFTQNRWGISYAGWRLLLLETLQFDMKELGFRE